jgi:glycosyltransferase involved in cell wall biosynthesis
MFSIGDLTLLSTSIEHGGAALAAKRWVETLQIEKTLTMENADQRRRRIARLLLLLEAKLFSLFWNRSLQGPTSISFFGAIGYKRLKKIDGYFFVHWAQNNFLSLFTLTRISKRSIFYCHDEWFITSLGHYRNPNRFDDPRFSIFRYFKLKILRSSMRIIVPTNWLRERLLENGIDRDKIHVVPNPVDETFFHRVSPLDAQEIIAVQKERSLITFIAHSVTDGRKGLNYFLECIEILVRQSINMEILIVGSGSSELSKSSRFHTIEYVQDSGVLRAIYSLSDVIVVPSVVDNLPQVAVEAQSMGTRVVASCFGGVKEALIDVGNSGFVVNPRNPEEMAQAVGCLLSTRWESKDIETLSSRAKEKWGKSRLLDRFNHVIMNL